MSVDLTPFESTLDYRGKLETDQVLCFLPVRLETRFVPDGQNTTRHMMIRVFPDDVHVDTHTSPFYPSGTVLMTPEEQLIALTFRQRMDAPGMDDTVRRALWGQLCGLVGTSRATYLGGLTELEIINAYIDSVWNPPYARALPSRWVALCYQGGVRVKVLLGNLIDHLAVSQVPDALLAGPDFTKGVDDVSSNVEDLLPTWMLDVGVAESVGMALFMDLPPSTQNDAIWNEGFDRIIVVGLHTGSTATKDASMLEELLTSHLYVKGLDRVAPSAPTSSTAQDTSDYARRPIQGLFERDFHSPHTPTNYPNQSESSRLARALGLNPRSKSMNTLTGASSLRDGHITHMHNLLWNVGLGYYTEQMLHPLTGWRERRILRALYQNNVRGDGPLSALRVGPQPYGILPTMAHSTYVPSLDQTSTMLPDPEIIEFPEHYRSGKVVKAWPFFATPAPWNVSSMTKVLQALRGHWLTQGVPHVPRIEPGSGDPTGALVQIIGHHHCVAQIRERAVVGAEVYNALVQTANWSSSPSSWQTQQESTINALLDTLHMRAPHSSPLPTPRIAGTHPFPVSQHLSVPLVTLRDASGTVLLSTADYFSALVMSPIASVLSRETWQASLPDAPNTLPLLAQLAHGSLHRALETTAWHITGKRGELSVYPPRTPEISGISSGVSGDVVPLQNLMEMPLSDLGLSVVNLTGKHTLEDAMQALLTACMNPSNNLEDILNGLFLNTVESWEIDEFYETCRALLAFQAVDEEEIEALLHEALDVSTHRLDAWLTALATQRLFHIRKSKPTGLHIGGYGVVEDVRRGKNLQSLGVLHAPSQAHAQTLAVIKSGQLNHQGSPHADLLRIDASSKRVRQAMHLIESMQQGQALGDVLGRIAERLLHELSVTYNAPDAKRLLAPLRRAFPIHMTNSPEGSSQPALSDCHTLDGLQLLRVHTQDTPGDVVTMLNGALQDIASGAPGVTTQERDLLSALLDELDTHIDAMHDVMLTESIHQSAQGNLVRAQAALGVLSGEATPFTELESMRTPYDGRHLTHRVGMLVSASAPVSYPWGHAGTSARTQLAPSLTAWIESWIPAPARYVCEVRGYDVGGSPMRHHVHLGELGLSGTDLLALAVDTTRAADSVLEAHIKTTLYKELNAVNVWLDSTRPLLVDWSPRGLSKHLNTFEDLLALLAVIKRTLSSARPLRARDLVEPGAILQDEYGWDEAALIRQIDAAVVNLTGMLATLESALTPGSEALDVLNANKLLWGDGLAANLTVGQAVVDLPGRTRLVELGELMHAVDPTFLDLATRAQLREILHTLSLHDVDGVLPVISRRLAAQDAGVMMQAGVLAHRALTKKLDQLQWDAQNADRDMIQATLTQVFGEHVLYTPKVTTGGALGQAFAAQGDLLDTRPDRLERWLTQVAQTHPQSRHLSDLRMSLASLGVLPEAMDGDELMIAQLPHQTGHDWLGDTAGAGQEAVQTLSLVCWGDDAVRQNPAGVTQWAGLFLDEWVEFIPDAMHTTGAAIHAESPKARAPQAMLLAVPDQLGAPWTLERVERTLLDTLDLARMRGVDPEALGSLSHLLPTLYLPFTTRTDDVYVSIDS